MIPLNEVADCQIFSESLGSLFLLSASLLPGNEAAASEVLLSAFHRWKKRPEEEWTLLNAQRDVTVEALQRAAAHPQELIPAEGAAKGLPTETSQVLALPVLERIVFLMGAVCRFGVEEIAKLLRIPSAEIRMARINAFRHLPTATQKQPALQVCTA